MKITKLIGSLSIVAMLTTSVYAETVTATQAATIVKQNIAKLTTTELSQVNSLVSQLQASGLNVVGAQAGTAVTAAQAAQVAQIATIMQSNAAVAAALNAAGFSVAAGAAAVSAGTLTAAGAAALSALAIGLSDSSATAHHHH